MRLRYPSTKPSSIKPSRMRFTSLFVLLALLAPACTQGSAQDVGQSPTQNLPQPEVAPVTVVAVGDIVCDPASDDYNGGQGTADACHMAATADLAASVQPDAVLLLGDNQYEEGTLQAYQQAFDPTWGRFKTITYPVPGNHEYNSGGAGYYAYFGERAGDPDKGYYSFDLGAWHLVALNANCEVVGGCETGSAQERWLREDLAAHPAACTLAFWHQPRFSSGVHNNGPATTDLWSDLDAAGAELVLSGHDHHYERFGPQDGNGQKEAQGLRQFVVGTGGKSLYPTLIPRQSSEVRHAGTYGVLKLELSPTSYAWTFLPEAGSDFSDSGTAECH